MLEVITRRPFPGSDTESHPVPLLFVHGAWHAAWCWDEHFLDFFAERGYACHALSLRGHGASPGRERLRRSGSRDYVADVAAVAAELPSPPVLIGHSMGGFVVQKYLESHTAPGAVLVASVPHFGVWRLTLGIARTHTAAFAKCNATLRLAPLVATQDLVRDLFFCAATPADVVDSCHKRVDDESYRAFLDMLLLDLVRTRRVDRIPLLVLGAERDNLFPPREIHRLATAYGAEAEIFPDMGHNMMLEPGWPAVAARIHGWLNAQGL